MFYEEDELPSLGLGAYGKNVKISKKASLYNAKNIKLGNNVRIDDFCVLSAGKEITIGDYVHIAVMCSLIGKESIILNNFSGISSRVSIYSSNDDYSGEWLTNPTIPERFTNVKSEPVILGSHCIVGSGSVLLPGTIMETGSALASLSLCSKRIQTFEIHGGVPAKFLKKRDYNCLQHEAILLKT